MAKKRYTHKQIRKSIKQDELRDLLTRVFTLSKKNTENILISVIVLAVIVILIPLYFNNREKNEQRANNMLNRAINYSLKPVAEGKVSSEGGEFRTLTEKYKQVQQSFAEISGTYRNTRAANLAKVGEANASFYLKEYAKAMFLYQEAKPKQPDSQLRFTLDERIAACHESLGQWQAALDTYQKILRENPEYFNQRAVRLHMARCYENTGQNDKVNEILRTEEAADPGSYWSEAARQKLNLRLKEQK
jgi:tetratricopeptide (TPR) repeat protein